MSRFLIIVMGLFFLSACVDQELKERKKQLFQVKTKANQYCSMDLIRDKDWLISTIYFKDGESNLKASDLEIMEEIFKISVKCPRYILVIGHSSDEERAKSKENANELSFQRAYNVKQAILQTGVSSNYVYILYCSNYLNRVEEDENFKGAELNQRVEIVFIYSKYKNYMFECSTSIDGSS